jgi:hypothetical protein
VSERPGSPAGPSWRHRMTVTIHAVSSSIDFARDRSSLRRSACCGSVQVVDLVPSSGEVRVRHVQPTCGVDDQLGVRGIAAPVGRPRWVDQRARPGGADAAPAPQTRNTASTSSMSRAEASRRGATRTVSGTFEDAEATQPTLAAEGRGGFPTFGFSILVFLTQSEA